MSGLTLEKALLCELLRRLRAKRRGRSWGERCGHGKGVLHGGSHSWAFPWPECQLTGDQ